MTESAAVTAARAAFAAAIRKCAEGSLRDLAENEAAADDAWYALQAAIAAAAKAGA